MSFREKEIVPCPSISNRHASVIPISPACLPATEMEEEHGPRQWPFPEVQKKAASGYAKSFFDTERMTYCAEQFKGDKAVAGHDHHRPLRQPAFNHQQ